MTGPTSQTSVSACDVPLGHYVYSLDTFQWTLVTGKTTADGRTKLTVEGQRMTLDYDDDERVHVCAPGTTTADEVAAEAAEQP